MIDKTPTMNPHCDSGVDPDRLRVDAEKQSANLHGAVRLYLRRPAYSPALPPPLRAAFTQRMASEWLAKHSQ